ncbi:MAG: GNAT family N-acetyltransferase [Hyphomicrobiaceae bacterium]
MVELAAGGVRVAIEEGLDVHDTQRILEALPEWFGRPDAIASYATEAARLKVAVARLDEVAVGLAALAPRSAATCEIAVMGLRPDLHGRGIGRRLVAAALAAMRRDGIRLALVRTLGTGDPDPFYARTRAFYVHLGFLPLIEIADHFGPGTPALLMVHPLAARSKSRD